MCILYDFERADFIFFETTEKLCFQMPACLSDANNPGSVSWIIA